MQTRPYPEKDGRRIWLSRDERRRLLDDVEGPDADPWRRIALQLGLHGLRTDEILRVEPQHVRPLSNGADGYLLVVPDGKTGRRELPLSEDLANRIAYLKNAAELRQDEVIVDVTKRTVRNWMADSRNVLITEDDKRAEDLGMHDLRRSWATDVYYSLAFDGVPIAEQLVMSWGGWKQTEKGRETFRENYLGPVPDHVTAEAVEALNLP